MSTKTCCIILAGGEGKRMKFNRPKVLSPVLFKPMLSWVADAARQARIDSLCVVTGYMHEQLEEYISHMPYPVHTVFQAQRKGTGHAVMMADAFLRPFAGGDVLVLNGDAPFIDAETIQAAHELHISESNAVTVISAELEDPFGYGRIVRDSISGMLKSIVEQKDANARVQAVKEVNSGAYWFDVDALLSVLYDIKNDNAQGEYYLPDAVKLILSRGLRANAYIAASPDTVRGANDCLQLHELNTLARRRLLRAHMQNGIDIPCTDGVIIGPDVRLEGNTTILPGTILRGKTTVGSGCVLGPSTLVDGCTIGDNVVLNAVQCRGVTIASGEKHGPFCTIEP
ncbi:MAG TPA: NTP transferase domain-containing protein [Candidatus Gallacutalibacter stercoravium]|nr:NTP transferase domain-containing protein [Candidatus Gallacutalibacter stercoravium]